VPVDDGPGHACLARDVLQTRRREAAALVVTVTVGAVAFCVAAWGIGGLAVAVRRFSWTPLGR